MRLISVSQYLRRCGLCYTCWLLLIVGPLGATQPDDRVSAWDALIKQNSALVQVASALERELLESMTLAQARNYLAGEHPGGITLFTGETLEQFLSRKKIGSFEIPWFTIDGGEMTSTGGDFALSGTIGQPDVGELIGGDFALAGGFWVITKISDIFEDGFESGDTSRWNVMTVEK